MIPNAPLSRSPGHEPASPEGDALPGEVVYLLDHDEQWAAHLAAQLGHFGYEVRVFQGPGEAIEGASGYPPSLLIAGIGVAQQGFAALEAVAHFARRGVPSVVLSAGSDFDAHLKTVNAGATAYFVKPVPCHDLLDAIEYLTETPAPAPYRVLIVEDSPSQAQHYSRMLSEAGIVPRVLERPGEILDEIETLDPDLILIDASLERHGAYRLAQMIRHIPVHLAIPKVFLSAQEQLDPQIAAMAPGADERLTQPVGPGQLVPLVTAKAERYRSIRSARDRDALTGFPDHCRLRKQIDVEAAMATRRRLPLCFAMVDIDNFAELNARYGQPAGHKLIKGLGRLLARWLRQRGVIGRYGGDEFGVIFPGSGPEAAQRMLEEARSHFAQVSFSERNTRLSATFSAGICALAPGMKGADLIAKAEQALQRAKRGGRDRVVLG